MNIAIIQCRLNSDRLHNKAFLDLVGRPVIWHVWNRVKQSLKLNRVLVATGDKEINSSLIEYCKDKGIEIIAGDQENVLKRYYDITYQLPDDANIVRITADCPLIDPLIIDDMLSLMNGKEYYTNQAWCIDGFDIEVIKASLLKKIYRKYKQDEHVTLKWKLDNPNYSKYQYGLKNLSNVHLSLDTLEDYKRIKKIYEKQFELGKYFTYDDVVGTL